MHELTAAIESATGAPPPLDGHVSELPHGKHLPIYRQATQLMLRLGEESQILSLIATATEGRVKESLKSAIKSAAAMNRRSRTQADRGPRTEDAHRAKPYAGSPLWRSVPRRKSKIAEEASNLGMNTQEVTQATTFWSG